jgi:hypothetical protein
VTVLAGKVAELRTRVSHLETNPALAKGNRERAKKYLKEMENEVY